MKCYFINTALQIHFLILKYIIAMCNSIAANFIDIIFIVLKLFPFHELNALRPGRSLIKGHN